MTDSRHLTEEERQGLADGTLAPERRADAEAHAASCEECGADVARLSTLVASLSPLAASLPALGSRPSADMASPGADGREPMAESRALDDLWPEIRSRIERGKVVPLGGTSGAARSIGRGRRAWLGAGVAAAALIAFALGRASRPRADDVVTVREGSTPVVGVADSARAYQQQVESLLEELELRRAMLRPSTAASVERDLRIIDGAIAELRDALARDPNNAALRALLAASYRQKRDLLKQVDNAS
jgi:hypothetical protein